MSEEQVVQDTPEVPKEEAPPESVKSKTPRLKASEGNNIIEDFKTGTLHPDYEIVTRKWRINILFDQGKLNLQKNKSKK
jgi:hypothetical protein